MLLLSTIIGVVIGEQNLSPQLPQTKSIPLLKKRQLQPHLCLLSLVTGLLALKHLPLTRYPARYLPWLTNQHRDVDL
jgi:hypothetical protein